MILSGIPISSISLNLTPALSFLSSNIVEILLFFNHPELLPKALKILTIVGFCLVLIIAMYVFPLLSHFENDNKKTFTNAIILAILNVPRTIWLFVLLVTPIVIVMVDMRTMIFYAFLGISLPALISSLSWSAIFKKYEPKKEVEDNGDDWVLEVEEGEASDETNTTEDEAEEKPQDID